MAAKHTGDADAIERRLLDLAFTTDVKITAPALAYYAACPIEDAAQLLEDLAARDRVRMEIEDDGTVVYEVPGRHKLGTPPAPNFSSPPAPERRMVTTPQLARGASPLLAALLTIAVPGAGHLYAGRIAAALMWFFLVSVGYVLILPGLLFHLFSIVSAAGAARLNSAPRFDLAAA